MSDSRRNDLGDTLTVAKAALGDILSALRAAGFTLVGPQVRENAIVYDRLQGQEQLPHGFVTEQSPGRFRLHQNSNERFFDFIPGADSWKKFLFPPRQQLLELQNDNTHWVVGESAAHAEAFAFVGVRSCELSAIQIQDRVFLRSDYTDATYHERRGRVFILAVNCLHPAGTCFCGTMGTGPEAETGYDLCLTELDEQFLVKIGSALGREIMQGVPSEPASAFHLGSAQRAMADAASKATCEIEPTTCAHDILESLEDPRWAEIAQRCLSCGNCTMACPTCFCWDVSDETSLSGAATQRHRVWDSCFNPSYSYQAGGNIRPSIRSRYRQWLSHKFGSWNAQFGVIGCVGCGRCITWCPAGIDTRVEVAAFQKETSE